MAAEVKWTPRAKEDLSHIYQYIAEGSVTYAYHFVNELVQTVEKQLRIFPLSGRHIPELENSPFHFLREVIYKNYRLVYNPTNAPDTVSVIAVHSCRMDLLKQTESWII